ncbi:hypothetical protein SAMN05518871_102556 [Psychrobacillus sp. OK028]|uniref:hypothetical protein n=1 Tax=Psychrobacillus sp. OK028 TaxID=1884359 RepID=UPI00088CB450|nr:hypothetical protein [Psychrobacillus sp. OK028]SDM91590.1 hypothetical protein SAMN05518871_102556 [Psychrobacillus sp. OK028]
MKKLSLLFTGLFFLLLTACNNEEPLIEIEVKISSISDDEYSNVGATKDLIEPKQEDFKVLEFTFNMKHTDAVTNRKVEMFEDWKKTLDSIDGIDRYWYGSASSQDNASENFAEYQQEIVFYAKGLSEEDIKNAFSDAKLTVSWTDNNFEQDEKQYKIADLLEFSNE